MGNVMAVASANLTSDRDVPGANLQNGYTEYLVDSTKNPLERNIFEKWLQDVFDKAQNNHYRKRACCTGSLHVTVDRIRTLTDDHTHGIEIPIANLWKTSAPTTIGSPYPDILPNPGVTNLAASYVTEGFTAIGVEIASINTIAREHDRHVLGKDGVTLRRLPFDQYGNIATELEAKCKITEGTIQKNYQRFMDPSTGEHNVGVGDYRSGEVDDTSNPTCKQFYQGSGTDSSSSVCKPHAEMCSKFAASDGSALIDNTGKCSKETFPTHKYLNIAYNNNNSLKERLLGLNYPLDCGCTNSVLGDYWTSDHKVFEVPLIMRRPATFDVSCMNQIANKSGGWGYTDDRNANINVLCLNQINIFGNELGHGENILISNVSQSNDCSGSTGPGSPPGLGSPSSPPESAPTPAPTIRKNKPDDSNDQMMIMMMVVVVLVVVLGNKK